MILSCACSIAFGQLLQDIVNAANDTVLAEIYDLVGVDATIELLERFAGEEVTVPSRRVLDEAARASSIFAQLDVDGIIDENVSDLANRYRISSAEVREIYEKTRDLHRALE